jgi:hypothetical protein
MISLNGETIIDIFSLNHLRRSTRLVCLNCGMSAEKYSETYCSICFSRKKWGTVRDFVFLLNEKNERKLFKTVDANSCYGKFLTFYNKWKNKLLDCFK